MKYSIGIDLGGTFIKFGAVGEDGNILRKAKIPTPQGCGYEETVDAIAGRIGALAAEMGAPCAVGVGCPGVIDGARGFVVTGGNLLWENKPFAGDLSRTAGVPVCVCNDANAAAYGEYACGAGKRFSSMVLLTLGTGVGSYSAANSLRGNAARVRRSDIRCCTAAANSVRAAGAAASRRTPPLRRSSEGRGRQ